MCISLTRSENQVRPPAWRDGKENVIDCYGSYQVDTRNDIWSNEIQRRWSLHESGDGWNEILCDDFTIRGAGIARNKSIDTRIEWDSNCGQIFCEVYHWAICQWPDLPPRKRLHLWNLGCRSDPKNKNRNPVVGLGAGEGVSSVSHVTPGTHTLTGAVSPSSGQSVKVSTWKLL